jgi:penicillin V acylase-like amidase (Ntn superfamily)
MDIIVANPNDNGLNSLRWAINQSNSTIGLDTISFAGELSGSTIQLESSLPALTDRVEINGIIDFNNQPLIGVDFNGNNGLLVAGKNANKTRINGLALSDSLGDCLILNASDISIANVRIGGEPDAITGLIDADIGTSGSIDPGTSQLQFPDAYTEQSPSGEDASPIGCTRVFWNDNSTAVLVGRNADWFGSVDPKGSSSPRMLVMPRGLSKSGAMYGDQLIVSENPAEWKSRFGSLVVSNINSVVFEGINEKGLAAHNLSLAVSDYGARDVSRQGLQMGLWVPYILDNAATVEEALSLLPEIQPIQVTVDNFALKVSLVIEDSSGDSALIEYLNGVPVVHRGPDIKVVTNTQLDEARKYLPSDNFQPLSNAYPLPGNNNTIDRFIRASYYSKILSGFEPRNIVEARAALMSVMRNVSNPFRSPYTTSTVLDETDWRSLSDLTNLVHIFDNPRNLNTLYTDLTRIDFRRGSGVRSVNPQKQSLDGNVTRLYRPVRFAVPGLAVYDA